MTVLRYLARGQRAADFVREIDVAGRVDEIEQKRACADWRVGGKGGQG
jgi:hypothetical protein